VETIKNTHIIWPGGTPKKLPIGARGKDAFYFPGKGPVRGAVHDSLTTSEVESST
jgi:hypothetical protein